MTEEEITLGIPTFSYLNCLIFKTQVGYLKALALLFQAVKQICKLKPPHANVLAKLKHLSQSIPPVSSVHLVTSDPNFHLKSHFIQLPIDHFLLVRITSTSKHETQTSALTNPYARCQWHACNSIDLGP